MNELVSKLKQKLSDLRKSGASQYEIGKAQFELNMISAMFLGNLILEEL